MSDCLEKCRTFEIYRENNSSQFGDTTLGHIDYKRYVDDFTQWLAKEGEPQLAMKCQKKLLDVFAAKAVHGRPILKAVLGQIAGEVEMIATAIPSRVGKSTGKASETNAPKKRAAKKGRPAS